CIVASAIGGWAVSLLLRRLNGEDGVHGSGGRVEAMLAVRLIYTQTAACLLFWSFWLCPKFQEIFRDFRTTLPMATKWLFRVYVFQDDWRLASWCPLVISVIFVWVAVVWPFAASADEKALGANRRYWRWLIHVLLGVWLVMGVTL